LESFNGSTEFVSLHNQQSENLICGHLGNRNTANISNLLWRA
jgi:hypothetical protein